MATKAMKWRTGPSGAEGTATRYVDSATGSDYFGDGTRANPYQSIGKAYRVSSTKPNLIVCRGRFSEMLADGNHACEIRGDYYGAATFDGAGYYVLYGFTHNNLIIQNTGVGTYDLAVYSGSVAFAGVGRANIISYVGAAYHVYGVAGASVLMDRCSLYWGCIGGTTAVRYVGVSRPRHNGTYRISLGSYGSCVGMAHGTLYDCNIEDRAKHFTSGNTTFVSTIFGKFAMIANDPQMIYTGCLFAADCKWYYLSGSHGSTGTVREIVITGSTSDERKASLLVGLTAIYDELEVASGSRVTPTFNDCKFSTQTSAQIFNNPDAQDFTLKPSGDGVINDYTYYGAFPPAINVPILDDSTGVPGSWDELTASGCVAVDDNAICLDETSQSMSGEIMSKIVQINPASYQLNGIYAAFMSKFADYFAYLNRNDVMKASNSATAVTYSAGDTLPVGRYKVKGAVVYQDVNFANNSIIVVTEEGTTFANDNYTSVLMEIVQPNIQDVIYCRCRSTIYVTIKASDGLQRGATYLNFGNKNVTYHGRTYVPGESFVAVNSEESFSCSGDADYEVGIMFDDTRVPSAEWVPAQNFGEYFVMKQTGAIRVDDDGVPVSSGNYLSFQTTANGGFSDQLRKTIINQRFVQFAIFVKKYDHIA